MASYCDNCGCRSYNGACVNCHEAVYIENQYYDLGMECPEKILLESAKCQPEIAANLRKKK